MCIVYGLSNGSGRYCISAVLERSRAVYQGFLLIHWAFFCRDAGPLMTTKFPEVKTAFQGPPKVPCISDTTALQESGRVSSTTLTCALLLLPASCAIVCCLFGGRLRVRTILETDQQEQIIVFPVFCSSQTRDCGEVLGRDSMFLQ